jgi:hypothetical protein
MVRLLVYALVNLVGIPCSYFVTQRRHPKLSEGDRGAGRKSSWLFAIAIWIDADVLLALLISLRHRFVLASAVWFGANFLYILIFASRTARRSK